MTLKIPFWVVAIITLTGWAFYFFHNCHEQLACDHKPIYKDSVVHTIERIPVDYGPPKPIIVPGRIDTVKVIEQHFTPQPFAIHYRDSSVEINHTGILYENRIGTSVLDYKNLRPTQLITHVKPDPRRSLSLGAFLGYSDAPILGGMAVYRDRRDRSFLVGYGLNQTMIFGVSGKITLRRR